MFEKEFPEFKKAMREILETFPSNHRMINCIEELSELQKELTKILRYTIHPLKEYRYDPDYLKNARNRTVKEIADVYITIEETKNILSITDDEIIEAMRYKLNRGVR